VTGESVLIARAIGGDESAFNTLAEPHRAFALRMSKALLADPDAAEDVAQEFLIRLAAALPGFNGESELRTWVYRVTLNLCRDHLRRVRRRTADVSWDDAAGEPTLAAQPDPERQVDSDRARTALRVSIGRLPAEQREAIMLRYAEGLPYDEIARITSTALGTVASRVFRGLRRLGDELDARHLEIVD